MSQKALSPLTLWLPQPGRLYLPERPQLLLVHQHDEPTPPATPPYQQSVKRPPPNLWPTPARVHEWLADYRPVALPTGRIAVARSSHNGLVEQLTPREEEILQSLATGQSNKEIAESLVLSVGTVKWHLINIYGKLGVQRRTQAVAEGQLLGLLSL
jgi:LuxR family maltose regulon positive regulatory protein